MIDLLHFEHSESIFDILPENGRRKCSAGISRLSFLTSGIIRILKAGSDGCTPY